MDCYFMILYGDTHIWDVICQTPAPDRAKEMELLQFKSAKAARFCLQCSGTQSFQKALSKRIIMPQNHFGDSNHGLSLHYGLLETVGRLKSR